MYIFQITGLYYTPKNWRWKTRSHYTSHFVDCRSFWTQIFVISISSSKVQPRLTVISSKYVLWKQILCAGLKEMETECSKLGIQFHFLVGCGKDVLPPFVEKHKLGAVVVDFSPLRLPRSWVNELRDKLPGDVPLVQVWNKIIIVTISAS